METCSGDQCLADSMVYCNETIGKCVCPTTRYEKKFELKILKLTKINEAFFLKFILLTFSRFIDRDTCVLKRWSNERCANNKECDESKLLTCVSGKCK